MDNNSNMFVKLFKTPKNYYIYDANKNAILNVERLLWDFIHNIKENKDHSIKIKENKNIYDKIKNLQGKGFLLNSEIKEIVHSENEVLNYYLNNKINSIILQVTQCCNLKCNYCPYSGGYYNRTHSSKTLDFETAKKGIDFLVSHSKDNQEIIISFYGGEPLIEFNLIKSCIEYVKENTIGKKVYFNITTNGTLINDTIIKYFEKNNVSLTISLDGPKEVHDKSRNFILNNNGTYDKVMENLYNIKEKFPQYYRTFKFNAVLKPENGFDCVNDFFNNVEIFKECRIDASEVDLKYSKNEEEELKQNNLNEDFYNEFDYEYFKYLLYKLNKLDEKYISKLLKRRFDNIKITYSQLKSISNSINKVHPSGPCIPGTKRLFMDVDGNLFPCEKASESSKIMNIGSIDKGFELDKIRKMLNIGKITEDKCKNCWAFRFCTVCAVSADSLSELSANAKLSYCESIKNLSEDSFKDICTLKEMNYNFEF